MRNSFRILLRILAGKRPAGRPRHRWKVIKMTVKEIRYEDVYWIYWLSVRSDSGIL
jgi:hypothetical protein